MRFVKRYYLFVSHGYLWRWWQVFALHGRLCLRMLTGAGGSCACIVICVPLPSMMAVGEKSVFLGGRCQGPAAWPSPLFCK